MEKAADLLKGIAQVLWPCFAAFVVWIFRPAIAALMDSARARRVTLKVAGQELTMEEVSSQQRALIADVQEQLVQLREKVEWNVPMSGAALPPTAASPATSNLTAIPSASQAATSVLWVDDNPKNNSYFVEQLEKKGRPR